MRIRIVLAIVAVMFIGSLMAARADDLPITKFAIDCTFETELHVHGIVTTGKVYIKGNKARRDVTSQGKDSIVIIDGDAKTVFYLLVAQRQCVPVPYKPELMNRLVNPTIPKGAVTLVGPDVLNGVQCTKYTITSGPGKVFTAWLDQQNYFARLESQDGNYSFSVVNLSGGPIQDSVFVVPGTYTQVDAPKIKSKDDPTPTPTSDK